MALVRSQASASTRPFCYLAIRQANSTTAAPTDVKADERARNAYEYACDDAAGRSGKLAGEPRRPSEPVEEYPGDNADDENQKKRYARVCGVHRLVRL